MAFTPATEKLIQALQALPGVGVRSAQRMALQLLEREPETGQRLSSALSDALTLVHKCPQCRTLTEDDLCGVCANPDRDASVICVVASDVDRAGIEMSAAFQGRYFVLHGVLSPIDGIGPETLGLVELVELARSGEVSEIMLALDDRLESEATVHFIKEQFKESGLTVTRVPFHQMKSGALDQADSRVIEQALTQKQTLGFEHD
ncbi:recombination mediator RecR [Reinekea blandensis]|uniref:Recombination protein RecR n=1 Tax=Reinekea blandensis MED297 TaxID=314283 RepID=A4BJR1_9GAMM|nr:recombination mediator RecR [Reinekea blandensis]EAR07636.1 recombination protein RecR [Reinekea sp. MED297] [Reinekea blandensis MED297]